MLVGGGMGIAPLVELARIYKDKSTALVGYRSKPFLKEELNKEAGEVLVASEDGSEGYKGFVTELLEKELGKLRPDLVYCCGPRPMMKRVVDICRSLSVGCQVSLEERMGCGIGACLVCSCATKGKDGGLVYSRVCKDGPVFWAEEVVLHG
jgi:dihydroorotate dehydrogenase electron transfer subunit